MIYAEALREAEHRWGEKGYLRIEAAGFNRCRESALTDDRPG
jgi:hypothetical protein